MLIVDADRTKNQRTKVIHIQPKQKARKRNRIKIAAKKKKLNEWDGLLEIINEDQDDLKKEVSFLSNFSQIVNWATWLGPNEATQPGSFTHLFTIKWGSFDFDMTYRWLTHKSRNEVENGWKQKKVSGKQVIDMRKSATTDLIVLLNNHNSGSDSLIT